MDEALSLEKRLAVLSEVFGEPIIVGLNVARGKTRIIMARTPDAVDIYKNNLSAETPEDGEAQKDIKQLLVKSAAREPEKVDYFG